MSEQESTQDAAAAAGIAAMMAAWDIKGTKDAAEQADAAGE